MIRGLMIKVINTEEVMETHKKALEAKKYVWYCYFGKPVTKPYGKGYANAFFIGNGKLYHARFSDIRAGLTHEGGRLPKSEIEYLPRKYRNNYERQDKIAFFLKCGVIIELNHDKALEYMYYEKTDEPYIPSEVQTSVCYVIFKNSLDNMLI
jgi:hypothetical protein